MRKPCFQICAAFPSRLLLQPFFNPNPHFSQTVHAKRLLSDSLFGDFSENISYFRYHFHCIFSCTPSLLQYTRCEMLVFKCTSCRPNISLLLSHSESAFLQYFQCEMLNVLLIIKPLLFRAIKTTMAWMIPRTCALKHAARSSRSSPQGWDLTPMMAKTFVHMRYHMNICAYDKYVHV